jgi:Cu-processing system ATP-binding protein
VMLPQGVRFECSREQKMAVLAVLAPLALQDIRLLEPSLEDMFFGFSG